MSHHADGYPIKLVRDNIEHALRARADEEDVAPTLTYERIEDRADAPEQGRVEHVKWLRKKLVEEAAEYLLDPGVGELADILAAIRALAIVDLGVSWHAVQAEEMRKHQERGGFVKGTVMVGHHPADGRPL